MGTFKKAEFILIVLKKAEMCCAELNCVIVFGLKHIVLFVVQDKNGSNILMNLLTSGEDVNYGYKVKDQPPIDLVCPFDLGQFNFLCKTLAEIF